MVTDEQHLAQLEIAWPEWQLKFSQDDQAYIATLRQDPEVMMAARQLATLEHLLMEWDRRRKQGRP
jgi:hypothetical protein